MKTAIITGASAGLGLEFVSQLEESFPEVDCVWLISRTAGKLEQAANLLKHADAKILPLDLCSEADIDALEAELTREKPDVYLLINDAGCGNLGNIGDSSWRTETRIVDLNIRALTAVSAVCVPHMIAGGKIINISSIASFCANARMTVYSSTKAYVSCFTRGLAFELKGKGIGVTAVCPGPMKTEFLAVGKITGNSKTFETLPYCDPASVAKNSLKAAKAHKAVYTPRALYKVYRVLSGIVPHALLVKIAKT